MASLISPRKHLLHLDHFANSEQHALGVASNGSQPAASYVDDHRPGTLGQLINHTIEAPPCSIMSFDRRVEVAELASSGGRSSHGAQTDSSSAAQISSMTAPIAAADSAVPSPYLMHLLASNNEQALKRAKLANAAAACAAIGSYNGAGKAADGSAGLAPGHKSFFSRARRGACTVRGRSSTCFWRG